MTLRYKVDSKLLEPVYIEVDEVVEIIPVEEYMSTFPALEGFYHDSPFAHSVYCKPEHRPVGNSSFHPSFSEMYQPVKLDNDTIVCVRKIDGREIKIGNHVRYDVNCDDITLFDTQKIACRLTLVEKTDGGSTTI